MSKLPTLKMKRRLNYIVIVAIILAFSIIAGNVTRITVFQYGFYKQKAAKQQLRPTTIPANRGTIYDRNMQIIAQSATVWDVVISPADIKKGDAEGISKALSDITGIDYESILKRAKKSNSWYECLIKKVEQPVANEIRKLKTSDLDSVGSISLIENTKRYYPNSTFASSLIGFTGSDSQGLYGLEQYYDKELRGTPGYVVSAKNGLGKSMPAKLEEKFEPVGGNSLVLTLDETIQHFLEKALAQGVANHSPTQGVAGIVMDVNTGGILAMANLPNFDLNQPWYIYDDKKREAIEALPEGEQKAAKTAAQQAQWSNKAISYAYQPGSTFKTVVASAALEEKTSSLKSTFFCPGYVIVGDRKMNCHKTTGHGALDFTGALVNSCNPSFVKIGADLGPDLFYKYFESYGLTKNTGIDLPGEGQSIYYTADKLGEVSLASCSFGQSMALTPIQLITAVSAVVNGGKLVTPHVVQDVLDSNNNIVSSIDPVIRRQVISEETSATMRMMMEEVVSAKGGTNASIKGYRIGGKSGTSQKQNPGDDKEARIASYVAVAPADNPKIAVFIMVDEPTSGDVYGSVISAPLAAAVLSDTLPYLGINPQYSEEDISESTMPFITNMSVAEAQNKLVSSGLRKSKVIGTGAKIVKQVPSAGSKMPLDGTVILYADEQNETVNEVPDVVGLTPAAAKSKLESKLFNVVIHGLATDHENSTIVQQSIPSGESRTIGTVIEITCIKRDTD